MQNINLWHLFRLLRRQIIFSAIMLLSLSASAQFGLFSKVEQYKDRPYYFGITLGYNQAFFQMDYDPVFVHTDTVLSIEPMHSSGFTLGLLGNLKMIPHLDLRFNPTLNFTEKNLYYVFKTDSIATRRRERKNIESIIMSLPLQVKFKSDRVGNFRAYLMAGIKYDNDLASNAESRHADDLVKLQKDDWGYEAGIGFEFYLPYFIFSPEIKFSYGARDVHVYEPGNIYSNRIGRLISRMIVISIHLEG